MTLGEIAQLIKCLLRKHENSSSVPGTDLKKLHVVQFSGNNSSGEVGMGIFGAHWLVSQSTLVPVRDPVSNSRLAILSLVFDKAYNLITK